MKSLTAPPAAGKFARWLYQAGCRPGSGFRWKISRRLLAVARSIWMRLPGQQSTGFQTDELGEIVLPWTHQLGLFMAHHPDYSVNLGRVAKVLLGKYPHLIAIDIGANIGDSARILHAAGCGPVLCIEGSELFLPYLRVNIATQSGDEVAPCFVSFGPASARLKADYQGGSMHFEPDASAGHVTLRDLSAILTDHPRFTAARLLKIDTDGLDLAILMANLPWLGRARPVLFLEYLPILFRKHGSEPGPFWAALAGLGYTAVVIYDNFGRFVSVHDAGAGLAGLMDALAGFDRGDDSTYVDLAVFHLNDGELAAELAAAERQRG